MNFSIIVDNMGLWSHGVLTTLQLTGLSVVIGLLLSIPFAVARLSSNWVLSAPVRSFIFIFRGTPLLVQIFIIYYGLGQFEWLRESLFWAFLKEARNCALLALTLNTVAYTTEIFRGAISNVPQELTEAAGALGLTKWTAFWRVTFPLAFRQALPAYGNEVLLMLHASSLASVITLADLTGVARMINARYYSPFEAFLTAAAIYLILTLALTRLFRKLEINLSYGK